MSKELGLVFDSLKDVRGLSDDDLLNELAYIEGDTQRLTVDSDEGSVGLHSKAARTAYIVFLLFLADYQTTVREEIKSRMRE